MKKIILFYILSLIAVSYNSASASLFIDGDREYEKQHGIWRSLFVHEDYYINPFQDFQIIVERDDDTILRYLVWWREFWPDHSLFINHSDTITKRSLQSWRQKNPWVYTRIVVKEDTYEVVDGVYTPVQQVWVTEYYRLEYNHDITHPECSWTYFSHDEDGLRLFQLPHQRWFNESKYAFFLCSDKESWCVCDEDSDDCFISWGRVFSFPKKIPHGESVSHTFINSTWLNRECSLLQSQHIYYDVTPPDIAINIDGDEFETSIREYVSVWWRVLDSVDIASKRHYAIWENIVFKADNDKEILIQIIDPLPWENPEISWVSWIKSLELQLFRKWENWYTQTHRQSYNYSAPGVLTNNDVKNISLQDIQRVRETFSRVWTYQIYLNILDYAGNTSMIWFHYEVVPWDVDPTRVVVRTQSRNMKYANYEDYYNYTITLRDTYWNIITGREIFNLSHTCQNQPNCHSIYQYLTSEWSSGNETLEIFDTNFMSDTDWNIHFRLRSIAPWAFTEAFDFEIYAWDENFQDTTEVQRISAFWNENIFLSPISGKLLNEVDSVWSDNLLINQETQYFLTAETLSDIDLNFRVSEDFESYIDAPINGTNFTLSGSLSQVSDGVIFSGMFSSDLNEDQAHNAHIKIHNNQISPITVSYAMRWYEITRPLSADISKNIPVTLWIETTDIERLRIVWISSSWQTWWSELSSILPRWTDIRNNFRRDVLRSIQTRVHDTTVWGVKYINGTRLWENTYTLSWVADFSTLIVRDANIVIGNNFNVWWAPVGIISVSSNPYSVENNWYLGVWNIYIDANVWEVHAFLYADGAVVSTIWWEVVSFEQTQSSEYFWNQLYIKWSIFSRNTVWWSQIDEGSYMLPWGIRTEDSRLASRYDLSQLRQGNNNCYEYLWVCRFPNYIIIDYDSRIISSPPPFFNR